MESADMQLVMFALIATIPLVGAMMAITPLLQPNGQAFSVSVPEVAQSDPGIRVLKHRFVTIIAALTAILTLVAVVFCLMGSMKAAIAHDKPVACHKRGKRNGHDKRHHRLHAR